MCEMVDAEKVTAVVSRLQGSVIMVLVAAEKGILLYGRIPIFIPIVQQTFIPIELTVVFLQVLLYERLIRLSLNNWVHMLFP